MARTDRETAVADPAGEVYELDHTVCCRDADLLLCGRDGSDMPWRRGGPECVECESMDRSALCPRFGVCLTDDRAVN